MKKGLMVALAAIAVTVSVAGCGGDGKLSNDYVTVNQYKGLEIAKVEKKEVSDDDVEQTIQSRLLSSGKTDGLTKDGAAEDGDWVNIDYSGSVDGTAFDGGTSTGYDLQLGSGTFLAATDDYKGFEEQIEAIARDKMPDLNCFTVEAAMRMVAGTARSMGINVKGEFPKK